MMEPQIEIMLIASLTAVACAIPGVFLVLRRMSLMSDAISHSVLLGIILAFFITHSVSSPLLIIGAALTGVFTVVLTEALINTKKVKEDAAIGLVFPFLFSIAIILITKFAENVHIDSDVVLLGELAFAPFNRLVYNGIDLGPISLWVISIILLINMAFILIFYKELKISTFDPALAAALGYSPVLLHYGLMTIVSITSVGAFDIVGSILVVAMVIAPPSAAYLFTTRLSRMLVLSAFFGISSAVTGYLAASYFDVSIGGSMATLSGIIFLGAFLFAPYRGLIAKIVLGRRNKKKFAMHMLAVHLLDHEGKMEEKTENRESTIYLHLKWKKDFSRKIIRFSLTEGLVARKQGMLHLTDLGRKTAQNVMAFT